MHILQKSDDSTISSQQDLAQFFQTQRGSLDASLLKEAYYAYHYSLGQLGVQANDYVVVSALVDPIIIEVILGHRAAPIFIDIEGKDAQMDTDVLEHFLSLLTIVNEQDELIYRKDERIIRTIVISHTFGIDAKAEQAAFIANRYNLSILEDFTDKLTSIAEPTTKVGTYGQIAIAKVMTGLKKRNVSAALVISNPPQSSSPFQVFEKKPSKIDLPNAPYSQASRGIYQYVFTLIQGTRQAMPSITPVPNYLKRAERWRPDIPLYFLQDISAIKEELDKEETSMIPYFGARLDHLQAFTFLSKEKIALRFLENGIWLG